MGLPKVGSALITPGCEGITDADENPRRGHAPDEPGGQVIITD